MKKELNNNLPDYLKDLATPTAIGREKLIALWDGLTLENQISLLTLIKDDYKRPNYEILNIAKGGERSGELPNTYLLNYKLLLKALDSKNDYVRHIAANELYDFSTEITDSEQIKINKLIDNDKSDLVKYTKYLDRWSVHDNFFKLPLEARLVIASSKNVNYIKLSEVIQKANDKGLFKTKKNETELNQVLWELVNNSEIGKEHPNKTINDLFDDNIFDFWNLVPSLPPSSGSILVEKFPIIYSGILPNGLFSKLTRIQQDMLFEREDFKMVDIRKEFYFKDKNEEGEMHWHTAPSYHLSFSDEEFLEILQKPEKERNERLQWLSRSRDMYLHHLLIVSFLVKYDSDDYWQRNFGIEFLDKVLTDYYKVLEEDEFTSREFEGETLYKFRIMSLACSSKRWADETAAPIPSLFSKIVKDDIWSTYLNFYDELRYSELDYKDLPISFRENKEDIPIALRNEVTVESSIEVLDEKIESHQNKLLNSIGKQIETIKWFIIIGLFFLMFWTR